MKNSEFSKIMHKLSWRGARGRPKGFDNKNAKILPNDVKEDLVKKIIKNGQALPKSLITEKVLLILEEKGYIYDVKDSFYGECKSKYPEKDKNINK